MMNVIKTIVIIGAIFGLLAFAVAPAVAQQFDKVWDRGDETNSWHDGGNWQPDGTPQAGDTVQIGDALNPFTVVISTADAACKTLNIGPFSRLEITGKTLTLGQSGTTTISILEWGGGEIPDSDGTLRFVKGGTSPGVLKVHSNVVFAGDGLVGGRIDAPTANDAGRIERAGASGGIAINPGVKVIGNITLLCDVDHKGGPQGYFGTDGSGQTAQTMVFGDASNILSPVPFISGSNGPASTSTFTSSFGGTIQFTIVDFSATAAPNWSIRAGTIQLTNDAGPTEYLDEMFDIEMRKGAGTLDLDHSLTTSGTLTVSPLTTVTDTIEVALGKIFTVLPPGGP